MRSKPNERVPKVGDTVHLNDYGLQQLFGRTVSFQHMKTLPLKVTYVSDESLTAPELSYVIEVDNKQINNLLITHCCVQV